MHFLTYSHLKVYYFRPNASAISDVASVKRDVRQPEATFHTDVGLVTEYRKSLTLSNQMSHYIRTGIRISVDSALIQRYNVESMLIQC